ncbi:lysine-specific demethylase JMJ30 isoform X3 [Physcomitrium patens]|uniref:lysine-specific demethylase JMJ30 isoform X3 n=1 Tax=Physcomitrium patens TaxID=3218 RepID=UPI000D161549|nr:lysine-specific demethylase JMJ30-like isoform X3 [Physcomitrium patens]|eukprot:XP_024395651.1 lysine-specific demethylase JMJ30-like isoform X3 [Physcomitrella patens]
MSPVAESQVLAFLTQVRNEGGVVFAGLAEKAWFGADEDAAEAAYELAWEVLHAGPWKDVPVLQVQRRALRHQLVYTKKVIHKEYRRMCMTYI